MVTQYKSLNYLLLGTILILLTMFGVWLGGPTWITENALFRLTTLGMGAVMVSCLLLVSMQVYRSEQKKLQIYAELVCDLDQDHDLSQKLEDLFPAAQEAKTWSRVFNRIRTTLQQFNDRILEANHARHGAEVRLKKITDYCQQLEQILGMIDEPVMAVNSFRELFFANKNAQSILKRLQDGGEDQQALKVLNDCNLLVNSLQETSGRATATHRNLEIELPSDNGNTVAYRASIKTLSGGPSTAVNGAVACLTDISSHRVLQKKHAQFVSNVSHEMKTPLAGIRAYIELLNDDETQDAATRAEFLSIIDSQATRMQRLIDNLLNIARIEAGVVNVSKTSQSLNSVLEEAIDLLRIPAEQRGITLKSELSSMYLGVLVDRDMILQTAINLLSNAIKYTNPGGTVSLRSSVEAAGVSFSVIDNGVGLSEEDQIKIFEKFYRVKKDQDMASGTGLGLPLAKHIVEDVHGGTLQVTSVEGQGSTFSVSLPGNRNS